MEMTSSVMRFALATYFMKRGGGSHSSLPSDDSPCASPSHDTFFINEDEADREEEEDVDLEFSDIVSIHLSNLRQLLVEKRFQEWSSGIVELRDYVVVNGLMGSLVALLVKMFKSQEQNAMCIAQVIEHMCFEAEGETSDVFDELTKLLFEALQHCCEKKDADVEIWLQRTLDSITHRLSSSMSNRTGDEWKLQLRI